MPVRGFSEGTFSISIRSRPNAALRGHRVAVPVDRRIGVDPDAGAVGAEPGQGHRRHHVDVRGEGATRLAGGALEHERRRRDRREVDPRHARRSGQPARGLPRLHHDGVEVPVHGGALQAVEPRDRRRGRVDPSAPRRRPLDPLGVIEQRPDGEDDQIATRLQDRRRQLDESGLRGGLDDDVGAVEQVPEPEEGRGPGQAGQELARPAGVAAGRAGERQARHPGRERPRDGTSDRPQPEDPDAARRCAACAPP